MATTEHARRFSLLFAAVLILAFASRSAAQQTVSDVLTFLVTNDAVRTGSVERDRAAAQATSDTMSRALLASIATLPVTSSSGAFVYRLNPALGTVERSTGSFGPFFVERAVTAGRGHSSIGIAFQTLHFTSLDGLDLRDGSVVTTANQFQDESAPFDVDRLSLMIDASVATLYANVGVTDRLEVGVAAPMIDLRVEGSRVNTYRGRAFTQASGTARSVGLADLVLRGKYNIVQMRGSGVAAAVDVRVPTGRQADLLGAGSTSVRLTGIGSVERGAVSVHVNGGVGTGGIAREYTYGGAVAVEATDRVTISGEVIARWLDVPAGIIPVRAPNPALAGVNTVRLLPGATGLRTATISPGLKWNLAGTWVLLANVLVPLTQGGLTAPITPFVGIDYAFGR